MYIHVHASCVMQGWEKGVVFINGVNLGRYWTVGPQRTLYVPGPVLRRGINKVTRHTNTHTHTILTHTHTPLLTYIQCYAHSGDDF